MHGLFASFLLEKLKSGDIKAAELNIIRQFLKDNNIECIGDYNSTILDITEYLPKFDNEDNLNEGDKARYA